MDYISQINVDNTAYAVGLPNIYINSKGNFNIETSAEIGNTSRGKINIESMDDIQFKPGDDIIFYSHHRAEDKQDEVAIKVTDGDDIPVKLQLNAAELVLTTKDKPANSNPDVLDIAINSNTNTRGYLKVRAQAIDLRCEKHGGIALQPKGYDNDGNMNKIKFEHGGGDGLEFGTFNTEKSSLYTDEYRFKKDGIWKMATRQTTASGKTIRDEGTIPEGKTATGAYKYVKNDDDFYDFFDPEDEVTDTKSIIKTANAFNYGKNRHAKYKETLNEDGSIKKKTIEIEGVVTYIYKSANEIRQFAGFTAIPVADLSDTIDSSLLASYSQRPSGEVIWYNIPPNSDAGQFILASGDNGTPTSGFKINAIATSSEDPFIEWNSIIWNTFDHFYAALEGDSVYDFKDGGNEVSINSVTLPNSISDVTKIYTESDYKDAVKTIDLGGGTYAKFGTDVNDGDWFRINGVLYQLTSQFAPSIEITSAADVSLKAKDGTLKLGGNVVEFGSDTVNFGEMEEGVHFQYKATKKGNYKSCDSLKVDVVNNTTSDITLDGGNFLDIEPIVNDSEIIPAQQSVTIAQCSILDIIKLVHYFKTGAGQANGPWQTV